MEVNISGAKIFYTFPFEFPILGKFQITETLVVSWIVMILITGLCIFLTRDLKVENISKRQALAEFIVDGVATNVDFQLKLIRRPEFIAGDYDNGFLNRTDILADERGEG